MRYGRAWLQAACAAMLLLTSGCYHVRLEQPASVATGDRIPVGARPLLPDETRRRVYVVRSGMAGIANSWTIEVGDAVTKYADAYLTHAFDPGDALTIRIDVVAFEVQGFAATTDLKFTVTDRAQQAVFQRDYRGVGKGRATGVVWGGAFAMKAAMRQTTDEALRSCFDQFLIDARQQGGWVRREAVADAGRLPE